EEIRADAARLERELPKLEHAICKRQVEEVALVILHVPNLICLCAPFIWRRSDFGMIAARMRVITFNANGIRSAASKGFFDWFAEQHADVVCVQETKSQEHQLDSAVHFPQNYHCYYHD